MCPHNKVMTVALHVFDQRIRGWSRENVRINGDITHAIGDSRQLLAPSRHQLVFEIGRQAPPRVGRSRENVDNPQWRAAAACDERGALDRRLRRGCGIDIHEDARKRIHTHRVSSTTISPRIVEPAPVRLRSVLYRLLAYLTLRCGQYLRNAPGERVSVAGLLGAGGSLTDQLWSYGAGGACVFPALSEERVRGRDVREAFSGCAPARHLRERAGLMLLVTFEVVANLSLRL